MLQKLLSSFNIAAATAKTQNLLLFSPFCDVSRSCEGQLHIERIASKYLNTAKVSELTETKEKAKKEGGRKRGMEGRRK